jgi:hypothetical protein
MNETKPTTDLPAVGVDIAKAKFDVCLWRANRNFVALADSRQKLSPVRERWLQSGRPGCSARSGPAFARERSARGITGHFSNCQRETPHLTGRATGIGKGVLNGGLLARIFHTLVARISNPLYRRASSLRRARKGRRGWFSTPCRLEIGDPAGWKSVQPDKTEASRFPSASFPFLESCLCLWPFWRAAFQARFLSVTGNRGAAPASAPRGWPRRFYSRLARAESERSAGVAWARRGYSKPSNRPP